MSTDKPEQCFCCGFETDKLTLYANIETTLAGGGKTRRDDFWYCDLCAQTAASNLSRYPAVTPSASEVLRTICYVGNAILAAIAADQPEDAVK